MYTRRGCRRIGNHTTLWAALLNDLSTTKETIKPCLDLGHLQSGVTHIRQKDKKLPSS